MITDLLDKDYSADTNSYKYKHTDKKGDFKTVSGCVMDRSSKRR